jgi:outer membrane scaffolding protein for murein synthesis (MipA/OmpV family)
MHCSSRARFGIAFAYFSSISAALAQGVLYAPDQQPSAWSINQQPAPWDINLAVGAAMQPTFHGSDRYRVSPIPLVIIRWHDTVSLGVEGLSVYWHHNDLRIGGGVNYDGGRLDHQTNGVLSNGDDRLKGLGDVDSAVGLRGFVSYKMGPIYLDTSATKYLGSQNKGLLANLGISAPVSVTKRFILRPHVGGTWADDNYTQTFFGVTSLQASRSMFPEFGAASGVEDINGGLTVIYRLNKHWFWGGDATATQYLDRAAGSPITISDTNATVATVIGYHF